MSNENNKRLTLVEARRRLEEARGPMYWRGLQDLSQTDEFQAFLEDEFPDQARPLRLEPDRRQFLTLAGASLALAGLSGCRFLPQQKIIPYVAQPEDLVLGTSSFYATAVIAGGDVLGVLAASREGRPIKLEGNPLHPASLGSTDAFTQASLLNLYDPDRSQVVTNRGEDTTFAAFLDDIRPRLIAEGKTKGAGVRILTETVHSPTLVSQIEAFLARYPAASWVEWQPVNDDNVSQGATLAFGQPVRPIYHFDKASHILSIDGDFLQEMPGHVRYARDFSNRRRVHTGTTTMNRLYVAECSPSITGAMADHRFSIRPSEIAKFAAAAAKELGVDIGAAAAVDDEKDLASIRAMVKDLQAAGSSAVVVVGPHQPPAVHALGHAMNARLGSANRLVTFAAPARQPDGTHIDRLRKLTNELQSGAVTNLIMIGGNPAYNAPIDIPFAEALRKSNANRVRLSLSMDETATLCDWHIPQTHFLEEWSDLRAWDGTVSIVQPLIEPLLGGISSHQLFAAFAGANQDGYEIVRAYWLKRKATRDFARTMERWMQDGVVAGTAYPARKLTAPTSGTDLSSLPTAPKTDLEIVFRPDPHVWDGRYCNNPWLQEMPKPITTLSWDNALLIAPETARKHGLDTIDFDETRTDEQAEITVNGQKLVAAVFVLPGHAEDCVTLHLGYGRERPGRVGEQRGFNAYTLRDSQTTEWAGGVTLKRVLGEYPLATTQHHHTMEGRGPVRTATFDQFLQNPSFARTEETENPPEEVSMYSDARKKDHLYEGFGAYQWGMSVDNNVCIGCNACVAACVAENNIPVVGKDQVKRGRIMHWIRIDTYYGPRGLKNSFDNPTTYFEPVLCMHCENAPCEPVCPVAAAVHSHEGLNMQVYNRCVGTRYCSNNCPYKVRRFNFYKYSAGQPNDGGGNYDIPIVKLSANPEVTVRGRGVMEKCSYCVQRINGARIRAKVENREVRDGDVRTACQQACPTQAIVFGDVSRPDSAVSKLKFPAQQHDYSLLGELNTRPRTTYLAKLRNPNPEIEPATEVKE